jgi:predicted TIM-barrel fold metal-dependent hydrolase
MSRFVFSADSHFQEPNNLFLEGLPPSLRQGALHVARDDKYIMAKAGDRVIHRFRIGGPTGRRPGSYDLEPRLEDMDSEGIDAELVFPQLCLYAFGLEDPELELATVQVYNDWCRNYFSAHLDRFVPTAVLPVGKLENTLSELKRVAALGYTGAMIPATTPDGGTPYNDPAWDPVFAFAAEQRIAFCLHTGTGLKDVVVERGPGAAVYNYTYQVSEAMKAITLMVAGGVLDRNPGAQVVFVESGASWLAGLAERMDEVYEAHHFYVRPELSRKPSEIVRQQVKCSFQYDRAGIMARSVTGHEALLWAADYPHMEGTFGRTREVLDHLFDGIEISEREKADIVGGTAARLFRLQRPEFLTAAN